jgi:hypothetical protein
MESIGDEKRIQALFSELSLEDQSRGPRFEKLWMRAGVNPPVPASLVRRFVPVFVALVVFAMVGLLATRSWTTVSQHAVNIPPQVIPATSDASVRRPEQLLAAASKGPVRPRKLIRPRQTGGLTIRQAAMISNWQSPTNILLMSPAVSVLNSLPQLNQSAQELEQFLPKNKEAMKESKQ